MTPEDEATAAIFVDMIMAEMKKRLHMSVIMARTDNGTVTTAVQIFHRDPKTRESTLLVSGSGALPAQGGYG